MSELRVILPWPPRALSPNTRRAHWSQEDDALIRDRYAELGATAIAAMTGRTYIETVERKQGEYAADRLRADFRAEWEWRNA